MREKISGNDFLPPNCSRKTVKIKKNDIFTSFDKDFKTFLFSILCSQKQRGDVMVILCLQVTHAHKYSHNFTVTLKEK